MRASTSNLITAKGDTKTPQAEACGVEKCLALEFGEDFDCENFRHIPALSLVNFPHSHAYDHHKPSKNIGTVVAVLLLFDMPNLTD